MPKKQEPKKRRGKWMVKAAKELGLPEDHPDVRRRARSLATMASRKKNPEGYRNYNRNWMRQRLGIKKDD